MTILHVSDVHFGRPHLPVVTAALLRFVDERDPEVVVVSGDLTQRAKVGEYRAARAFLDDLGPRRLVTTAGNHDVPLYRFWERLFAPYRNYRANVAPELNTVLDLKAEGGARPLRFVALNSSAPLSAIVNGRLDRRQLHFAANAFRAAPEGALRVLVVHHNLVIPTDGDSAPPMRGARRVLNQLGRWRVDLVLSGHIHRTHLGWTRTGPDAASDGVPVVLAGTTTSNRGRGSEEGRNSLNLIRVLASDLEVTAYLYSTEAGEFQPAGCRRYSIAGR
ncbi:MAG: metallophosphoesterase [Gemmatimonadota bacterium]|nr:metallophosphoesterase [Gemmatimonadota bacterium]